MAGDVRRILLTDPATLDEPVVLPGLVRVVAVTPTQTDPLQMRVTYECDPDNLHQHRAVIHAYGATEVTVVHGVFLQAHPDGTLVYVEHLPDPTEAP